MGISEENYTILWTRQAREVMEEIENCGKYLVKEEYIRKKNDSISDYYLKLYRWYRKMAEKHIRIEENEEYPIWFNLDSEFSLRPVAKTVTIKARVPKDSLILCNYDAWGYIVNYFYVPTDEEDKLEHRKELKKYGITSDDELFLTDKGNFYPLLKRKIENSWKRLFELRPEGDLTKLVVATTFVLKKEWIEEVSYCED